MCGACHCWTRGKKIFCAPSRRARRVCDDGGRVTQDTNESENDVQRNRNQTSYTTVCVSMYFLVCFLVCFLPCLFLPCPFLPCPFLPCPYPPLACSHPLPVPKNVSLGCYFCWCTKSFFVIQKDTKKLFGDTKTFLEIHRFFSGNKMLFSGYKRKNVDKNPKTSQKFKNTYLKKKEKIIFLISAQCLLFVVECFDFFLKKKFHFFMSSTGPPLPRTPPPPDPSAPPTISLFVLSLGVFSLNFGGVFEGRDPQMCTFGLSGSS